MNIAINKPSVYTQVLHRIGDHIVQADQKYLEYTTLYTCLQ